jgi:hypothetical protein
MSEAKRIAQIVLMQCDVCASSARLRQRRYERRLFGKTIRVPVELAACEDCDAVVECESIPASVEELVAYKAEILREARALGHAGWPDDQGFPDEAEIDEQMGFVPHRLGPARCLACGGTRLERATFAEGNPVVPHRGCRGRFVLVGLEYVDDTEDVVRLDIEGERIAG